jgi:hypothetical protein
MLHCHTISYHCASIIADCSNTGQWKNNIFYLLSSLQRQHHHSTSCHILDHDRSIAARWIVKTVGEVIPTLLRFGSRVERCSGGQRGRRGRAAAEACVASAAGADARPADPPAAASSSPSCKGQGCKTESVMIGMNALIDLEYAAGTLSVECTDEQSMYSVQTAFKLF